MSVFSITRPTPWSASQVLRYDNVQRHDKLLEVHDITTGPSLRKFPSKWAYAVESSAILILRVSNRAAGENFAPKVAAPICQLSRSSVDGLSALRLLMEPFDAVSVFLRIVRNAVAPDSAMLSCPRDGARGLAGPEWGFTSGAQGSAPARRRSGATTLDTGGAGARRWATTYSADADSLQV